MIVIFCYTDNYSAYTSMNQANGRNSINDFLPFDCLMTICVMVVRSADIVSPNHGTDAQSHPQSIRFQ